jgi:hypothetical protein
MSDAFFILLPSYRKNGAFSTVNKMLHGCNRNRRRREREREREQPRSHHHAPRCGLSPVFGPIWASGGENGGRRPCLFWRTADVGMGELLQIRS